MDTPHTCFCTPGCNTAQKSPGAVPSTGPQISPWPFQSSACTRIFFFDYTSAPQKRDFKYHPNYFFLNNFIHMGNTVHQGTLPDRDIHVCCHTAAALVSIRTLLLHRGPAGLPTSRSPDTHWQDVLATLGNPTPCPIWRPTGRDTAALPTPHSYKTQPQPPACPLTDLLLFYCPIIKTFLCMGF